MGVDAHIAFRASGPIDDLLSDPNWPKIGMIVERRASIDCDPFSGEQFEPLFNHTHIVETAVRYWDGDNERDGMLLVTSLLYLMRHPNIETVWYGPDGFKDYKLTSSRMMELVQKLIQFRT